MSRSSVDIEGDPRNGDLCVTIRLSRDDLALIHHGARHAAHVGFDTASMGGKVQLLAGLISSIEYERSHQPYTGKAIEAPDGTLTMIPAPPLALPKE